MAVINVEGAAQGVPAVVQGLLLRRVRMVVSGLRAGTARAFGQESHGCGVEQAAILKG